MVRNLDDHADEYRAQAEYYREKAGECEKAAESAKNQEAHDVFRRVAQSWRELADSLDRQASRSAI